MVPYLNDGGATSVAVVTILYLYLYLNDGGATSVAVVTILLPSYYHTYFVSNVHKKTLGRNMLWLLHWSSYKRQV